MILRIPSTRIHDWDSFHAVFAELLGFPDFYGRNMDAWADCMTYLDDEGAGMTSVHVEPGEVLVLHLEEATEFSRRCPTQFAALVECAAFVNWRRVEQNEPAVLALSFFKQP